MVNVFRSWYQTDVGLLVALLHVFQSFIHDVSLIRLEISDRYAMIEEFVNLLQRPAFSLGKEEIEEDEACKVRTGPDIAVLGALCISSVQYR